jgi:hypothetical protein
MVWWFNTRVALHNGSSSHGGKHSVNSNSHASQHACSSLCDEIVILWRLAALNPGLSPEERDLLINQFKRWHIKIVDKVNHKITHFLVSISSKIYGLDFFLFYCVFCRWLSYYEFGNLLFLLFN